jgi:GTPase SAR1 family protein
MQKKRFRISAKKLYLTYSQINPGITAEYILEYLKNKTNYCDFHYVIGKESHKDGGTHFHVVLIKNTKFDIKNPGALDIEYQEQNYHGNYTPVRYLREVVAYACKDNHYITNLSNLRDGKLLTAKEFIIQQVQEKGVEQALIDHYSNSPDKAIAGMSISALKKHFHDVAKLEENLRLDKIDTPFGLEHFAVQAQLKQWMENPKKTLVLVGDSGLGKTQFCKAFVKEKGLKTLIVNHKEDFRRLNSTYDAIIIDDANIHEFEETQLLSLIDNETDKTLRVLYNSVVKKAGIIQMIAMNYREFIKVTYFLDQKRFARRLLLQKPQKPFIVNVNVQINNNIVNINQFNGTEDKNNQDKNYVDIQQHQEDEELHVKQTQQMIRDIVSGKI